MAAQRLYRHAAMRVCVAMRVKPRQAATLGARTNKQHLQNQWVAWVARVCALWPCARAMARAASSSSCTLTSLARTTWNLDH